MTKISENFDIREFVPPVIFNAWGLASKYFIRKELVSFAEFLKQFFTDYYRLKYNDPTVKVSIVINDWHYGGVKDDRGFRTPTCTEGGALSQHKFGGAIDTDIIINVGGKKIEADYRQIHQIVRDNEVTFMKNGLTTVEDIAFAPTWMHWDMRWTGLKHILVVKPVEKK